MLLTLARRAAGAITALRRDEKALALTEFALGLPILLTLGCYGVEESNLALTHLRISQYALALADNGSRVGLPSQLATQQLREVDINDVLQATRLQGSAINLTTYGRVTLSSLENVQQDYDTEPVQRIHWQRCIGKKSGTGYDSTYGTTKPTDGTDSKQANAGTESGGMGDAHFEVDAPSGSGLMFVEINYDYQPLFLSKQLLPGTTRIHYIASFIVRDRRDFSHVWNPDPAATLSTCDLHNA